jgi:Bifunctional DNA primase/polymerase, N-terminal/Protein of unknown function (DUF3987)/Primase C terminal 1 (PriCT-1)
VASNPRNLRAALRYAARGWAVLPIYGFKGGKCACGKPDCPSPGKHPRTKRGVKEATTDAQKIREWWTEWPNASIGIATGRISELLVLDVDPRNGGDDSLERMLGGKGLPKTPTVQTGGSGLHLYFELPEDFEPKSRSGILPGLDVKAEGGFVVAPPSQHQSGNAYLWRYGQTPNKVKLGVVPDWLSEPLSKPKNKEISGNGADGEFIPEGRRHDFLVRVAGALRRQGATTTDIEKALLGMNLGRCDPPLSEAEVRDIANSAENWEPAPRSTADQSFSRVQQWPDPLDPPVFHGLAGDFVRTIGPHTEADPAALLAQLLTAFGNMVGRRPHFVAEADRHGMNLFEVIVGATSKGRKGSSWGHVRRVADAVDKVWSGNRIQQGLSSGEGLVFAVRDAIEKREPIREKGRIVDYEFVTTDFGVEDKRLLVLEPEFASVLRILDREGSTLSAIIRQSWDNGALRILNKNSPTQATDAHISLIGHITADELRRYLTVTEKGNGFANRILWICARRSKSLPEGGSVDQSELQGVISRIAEAAKFARSIDELRRTEKAARLWREIYPELSAGSPGLLGAVTSRAEAQVMRLASIYALLDSSKVIKEVHLRAALALWKYAEQSARYVFGDSLGNPMADQLLKELRKSPDGMTRTEIRDLFGRNRRAEEIEAALASLAECGLARTETDNGQGRGRPSERWVAL